LVVSHHRLFNLNIDLLLRPIGGRHKAVETRQIQEETNQANAAGPDFDADHMERMIRLKARVRYSTVSQGLRAIQNVSFEIAPGA
jgi:hypothetical protein